MQNLRTALRQGLQQLGEEGAIQVFTPVAGGSMMLGAIGQLQFEVVLHRLKGEYGVEARLDPCRFSLARWITCGQQRVRAVVGPGRERPPRERAPHGVHLFPRRPGLLCT